MNTLIEAVEQIRMAKSICVFSGAGMSKESGLATFRDGDDSHWSKYNVYEMATPTAYLANPSLVWDWYTYRRQAVLETRPNAGHIALAQLERIKGALPIITQNVDNLHERGGSTDVIHLHGEITKQKCFYDCEGEPTEVNIEDGSVNLSESPPRCPYCHRPSVRPQVVWFGELLPADDFDRAVTLAETCDVMLMIGTSGIVYPAASLPLVVLSRHRTVIEINPNRSELTSRVTIWLQGKSGEVLPELVNAVSHAL